MPWVRSAPDCENWARLPPAVTQALRGAFASAAIWALVSGGLAKGCGYTMKNVFRGPKSSHGPPSMGLDSHTSVSPSMYVSPGGRIAWVLSQPGTGDPPSVAQLESHWCVKQPTAGPAPADSATPIAPALAAPQTRAPARDALGTEGLGGLDGVVREDAVGARAPDGHEHLDHRAAVVQHVRRGGGLEHRVLARHVVREERQRRLGADRAHHVEVGQGRLDHEHVGALLLVEPRF